MSHVLPDIEMLGQKKIERKEMKTVLHLLLSGSESDENDKEVLEFPQMSRTVSL